MPQTQQTKFSPECLNDKWNERILVVKRNHFFLNGAWNGLKSVDFDYYLNMIQNKKEFVARGPVETDYSYKQIIPYLVFEHEGSYFLMQRKKTSSESRLANKYSLGIGGHLREEDTKGADLFEWARREFNEEIKSKKGPKRPFFDSKRGKKYS